MGDDTAEAIICLLVLLALAVVYEPTRPYAIGLIVIVVVVFIALLAWAGRSDGEAKKKPKPPLPLTPPPSTLPSTLECSNCGSVNAKDQGFCGRCGASLKRSPIGRSRTLRCPQCNYMNWSESPYCPVCGTPLEQDETRIY